MIDKMKQIQNIMPYNGEILVRTEGKGDWFIHYFLNTGDRNKSTIYKTYTKEPEEELNKIIGIITSENHLEDDTL